MGPTWIAAAAMLAQAEGPAQPDDTIVVTALSLPPSEARRRAAAMVRAMGIERAGQPIARWVDPVCPRAANLAPEYAHLVEMQFRAIAAAADVPLARTPCRPNIVVTFVTDGAALAREIAKRSPRSLAEVPAPDRAALLGAPAPVRWWYATATTGADGDILAGEAPAAAVGHNMGGNAADVPVGVEGAHSAYRSSVIATQTVRVIRNATVVVDVVHADGKPIAAVVGYAAMVALAELRPTTPPPAGSVLALFAGDPAPGGLTSEDRSLLAALYHIPLARLAAQQHGMLVSYTADRLRRPATR